jgi:hypothetical protein
MKLSAPFALLGVALGLFAPSTKAEVDCVALTVVVKNAVIAKPAEILQTVESQVQANPDCACEIVKAAIETSKADVKLVAAIVETASTAAPEKMRIVAQCAVAVMPDSLADVQAVLAKLDPNSGHRHSDSKDAKDAKAPTEKAPEWNPLNFPGQGPIGPNPGGPGGYPVVPPGLPPGTTPPSVNPPLGSNPNFHQPG